MEFYLNFKMSFLKDAFFWGEDDVPMKDHAQEMPKTNEIQEVLKILRDQLEDQMSFFLGRSSTCSNILILVA